MGAPHECRVGQPRVADPALVIELVTSSTSSAAQDGTPTTPLPSSLLSSPDSSRLLLSSDQLWLITARDKISAGTFGVSATGDGFVQATYALDANALRAVAVTQEAAGGAPQPTSPPVVVGAAQ